MKWTAIILLVVGVAAATCAAVVLHLARGGGSAYNIQLQPNPEVKVVVATRALPAMSKIEADALVVKTLPKDQAPARYVSDPLQVIGKANALPVTAGQALTLDLLADSGARSRLAAEIPAGMRAVAINVSDFGGLEGVIYPGSRVDVMAAFKGKDTHGVASAFLSFSTVLVENVQVLAVENTLVVTSDMKKPSTEELNTKATKRITLLVDPKQAKRLELAMQMGALSLAMRNPLDAEPLKKQSIALADLIEPEFMLRTGLEDLANTRAKEPPAATPTIPVAEVKPAPGLFTSPPPIPAKPAWETTVYRGGVVDTQTFTQDQLKNPGSRWAGDR